ncbi:MAG: hypothetical protein KDE03_11420 [Rhodobacteraceae bacterium]|nr:hypothetical protein [Paracoccaceae bacterium]
MMKHVEVTSTPPADDADVDLTMDEVRQVMHWAREAKNGRVDTVLVMPGVKGSRLFIKPCDFRASTARKASQVLRAV